MAPGTVICNAMTIEQMPIRLMTVGQTYYLWQWEECVRKRDGIIARGLIIIALFSLTLVRLFIKVTSMLL
jgi:hypothetical protein